MQMHFGGAYYMPGIILRCLCVLLQLWGGYYYDAFFHMIKQRLDYCLSVTQLVNGKVGIQTRHFGSRATSFNHYT